MVTRLDNRAQPARNDLPSLDDQIVISIECGNDEVLNTGPDRRRLSLIKSDGLFG